MRSFPAMLAALLVLLAAAVPATAAKKPEPAPRTPAPLSVLKPVKGKVAAKVGIADQKADAFADPRLAGLGIRTARRSIAWDTMQYDWQVADVDAWVRAAQAAGVRPLITIARSRIDSRRHLRPTAAQIASAFRQFRQRWPQVTSWVASNESNHFGEPTGRRPELAAKWYKAMRQVCPTCRIAAATLLDYPNLVTWTQAFVKAAKEQPKFWALHNYVSANRFDATRTRAFLEATKGEVWITEVGGAVKRPRGQAKFPEGLQHAAKVTRYVLEQLVRLSPRVTEVYLYHWSAAGGRGLTWDSAFIGPDGRPRPAFRVLEQFLKGSRRLPAGTKLDPAIDVPKKAPGKDPKQGAEPDPKAKAKTKP